MSEIFFLVEEAEEGGFVARALGESIFTEAETLDALRENVRGAVHCHFEEREGPKVFWLNGIRDGISGLRNGLASQREDQYFQSGQPT